MKMKKKFVNFQQLQFLMRYIHFHLTERYIPLQRIQGLNIGFLECRHSIHVQTNLFGQQNSRHCDQLCSSVVISDEPISMISAKKKDSQTIKERNNFKIPERK